MSKYDSMGADELRLAIAERKGWKFYEQKDGTIIFSDKQPLNIPPSIEIPYSRAYQKGISYEQIFGVIPFWSVLIADAWILVEEIGDEIYLHCGEGMWQCGQFIDGAGETFFVEAPTAPLAICRAWLEWKDAEK